ncbi:MAG: alpha/beta fold hydrolase [Blastocatellia bacterium]
MHLERYGSGQNIYFGLHGWSGSCATFAPLACALPDDATLYSADLPGCGKSPAPRRWDLSTVTEEIAESIALVAETPVTVIGNCSGALLGLLATRQLKGKVGRLVLIDPFAYWPWYFRVFVAKSFGRYAYYSTFANPFGRWITNRSLKSKRAAATNLTESFAQVNHDAIYRYLLMLAEIGEIEQFGGLRLPVEIVYGARTFRAVKASVVRWQSLWPQSRCWELAGAGHLPIVEATPQLSEIIFGKYAKPAS